MSEVPLQTEAAVASGGGEVKAFFSFFVIPGLGVRV